MSETQKAGPSPSVNSVPSELQIHFVKTAAYRIVHADGVWFGGNAQGGIFLSFYSEHNALPNKVVAKLNDQGFVDREIEEKRDVLDGLVREIEVQIALTIPAAAQLLAGLSQNLKNMQAAVQQAEQDKSKK